MVLAASLTELLDRAQQQRVWHPAGVQDRSHAATRRSPPQETLGDLRLPSGKPFGLLIQNVQIPAPGRDARLYGRQGYLSLQLGMAALSRSVLGGPAENVVVGGGWPTLRCEA